MEGGKENAMTPLNYGTWIMEALGGFVTLFSKDNIIKYGSFTFCIIWGIFYAVIYVCWMRKDPNRLQTENYNLQTQALVLGKEGASQPKQVINLTKEELNSSIGSSNPVLLEGEQTQSPKGEKS